MSLAESTTSPTRIVPADDSAVATTRIMHVPAISWVHPPEGFLGLSLLNGVLRILTLGIYHFWGKTEVRQRIWSAVRIDGEPLDYRGTGGRAVPRLPHRLLPDPAADAGHGLCRRAAVEPEQSGTRALRGRLLRLAPGADRDRHSSRAPLPAVAHALARHPGRPIRALLALRLALSVDHGADPRHARLDRALAHGAPAEGAVRRYLLRRQGLHLQRPRRTALQALLAGMALRHHPFHRRHSSPFSRSLASTCSRACLDLDSSRAKPRR